MDLISILKQLVDGVEWVLKKARLILTVASLTWLLVGASRLTMHLEGRNDWFRQNVTEFVARNEPEIHVVGLVVLLAALASVALPNWSRIKYGLRVFRRAPVRGPVDDRFISEQEVQEQLQEFTKGASSVAVIASDADFLLPSNAQYEEILRLGHRCQILLSPTPAPPTAILKRLHDAGVQIRSYPPDVRDLHIRGRLKRDDSGAAACLFDKTGDGYRIIDLENQDIVRLLQDRFDDWFGRGRNPLIQHVILDAGGVSFDGDIAAFYAKLKRDLEIEIRATQTDYSVVDEDLNLGRCTIVDVVKRKAQPRTVSDTEAELITTYWNTTWHLNQAVADIVAELRELGLTVSLCSNCDLENADAYFQAGYFDPFDNHFLSCHLGVVKPKPEFFEAMTRALKAEPWECLFIDDDQNTVEAARAAGFNAARFPHATAVEERQTQLLSIFETYDVSPRPRRERFGV